MTNSISSEEKPLYCDFGEKLNISLSGSSRGERVSVAISGFPEGFAVDAEELYAFLLSRAPGHNAYSSRRREDDIPVFESGISNGITDGKTIRAYIKNTDIREEDESFIPRPSHADYPAFVKYGHIPQGGGEFSGRMTAPLCIAGGLALQYLRTLGIKIGAHVLSVGGIYDRKYNPLDVDGELFMPRQDIFPVLDTSTGERMKEYIAAVSQKGDSVGGKIECAASGIATGIGEALFGSLESRLSQALFAIPAVKAVEFGAGTGFGELTGSKANDEYYIDNGNVRTYGNNCGGICGGLTTGMPVIFTATFKPTPSIRIEQRSVDLRDMSDTVISCTGRNDPCIVPRAVPAVMSCAAVVILDTILSERNQTYAG